MSLAQDYLKSVPPDQETSPKPKITSKNISLVFVIIGIVAAAILSYYWFIYSSTHITTDNA
jgi:multidrug resistance efflux pump